jgi:hypothetical protein
VRVCERLRCTVFSKEKKEEEEDGEIFTSRHLPRAPKLSNARPIFRTLAFNPAPSPPCSSLDTSFGALFFSRHTLGEPGRAPKLPHAVYQPRQPATAGGAVLLQPHRQARSAGRSSRYACYLQAWASTIHYSSIEVSRRRPALISSLVRSNRSVDIVFLSMCLFDIVFRFTYLLEFVRTVHCTAHHCPMSVVVAWCQSSMDLFVILLLLGSLHC